MNRAFYLAVGILLLLVLAAWYYLGQDRSVSPGGDEPSPASQTPLAPTENQSEPVTTNPITY